MDESQSGLHQVEADILVIGGGTAGPMAAYKAKCKNPNAKVVLLEKANVKRSGAISMGMDGLNNTVIPGHATPEQYTKEITVANDGIVDQKAVLRYAESCYDIINELDSFGIRFQKDETGEYDVKKVHHVGTYVLPMPNGDTVKFDVDPHKKHCLLNGLDDIGLTMGNKQDIDGFEGKDDKSRPWMPSLAAE